MASDTPVAGVAGETTQGDTAGRPGTAGAAFGAAATSLALMDQASLVGSYSWVEHRLYEVLGGWVALEPVDEARLLFDAHSQEHAWHARLFADRLPVLDGLDRRSLTAAPSPALERLVEAAQSAEVTLLRLAGIGRVLLPRLVCGYVLHLQRASSVAEAPLARALRLVLGDELEAWRATESLLERLLRTERDVRAASDHACALEARLAAAGGEEGLVPWPVSSLGDCGA